MPVGWPEVARAARPHFALQGIDAGLVPGRAYLTDRPLITASIASVSRRVPGSGPRGWARCELVSGRAQPRALEAEHAAGESDVLPVRLSAAASGRSTASRVTASAQAASSAARVSRLRRPPP